MSDVHENLVKMKNNPKGLRFSELKKVCEHYFACPVKVEVVTASLKRRGRAIRGSTYKTKKERRRRNK